MGFATGPESCGLFYWLLILAGQNQGPASFHVPPPWCGFDAESFHISLFLGIQMTRKSTRRRFLGESVAVGAGFWMGTRARPGRAQDSALNSLAAASIGVGGKGDSDSTHAGDSNGVRMVGLCDIDRQRLVKKGREYSDAQQFDDYREMLDKLADKVDVVTVSTPDHHHALAAYTAMKLGKHVYCQKPLTWSIAEARLLQETAKEMGVVTQMGNQGTAADGLREAVEVIRSGAIGEVREVHIWTNRPVWPQGKGRPDGSDPIPEHINWENWIGPAPMRPFKENEYHDFNWRGWLDFGTGALGDMACHTTNMPVMALKLFDAKAVTALANSGLVDNETYPASSTLKFEFGERDEFPPCDLYWYDGGAANNLPPEEIISKLPEEQLAKIRKQLDGTSEDKTSGAVLVGTEGMLYSPDDYGAKYYLLPEDRFVDYKKPEPWLPRIPARDENGSTGKGDERQKWEFINTILEKYEPGTMSNFGYAGRLTETILVGNLALRAPVGARIEWDAKNLRSPNVEAVNEFVSRTYREGWVLEPLAKG